MCKRTMYKRARIPMFLWERRACANRGAQAVFPRPRKKRPGNEASTQLRSAIARVYVIAFFAVTGTSHTFFMGHTANLGSVSVPSSRSIYYLVSLARPSLKRGSAISELCSVAEISWRLSIHNIT